jgi:NAD(P)-dependent dehydrogenase (short-subunit alcohol dehydrogenase family)
VNLHLDGKLALVTGGSAGIGHAVALALVAEGCRVVVVGRDEGRLTAIQHEAGADKLSTLVADLVTASEADRVAKEVVSQHGVPDILVNSAGSSQGGLFWTMDDKVWDDSFGLKLMGTIRMLRAVVPLMVAAGRGNVVNIVGNSGRQPGARFLPGSAANAALLAVTKGLADEVATSGVVINAISPGPTRTARWTGLMEKAAAETGRSIGEVEQSHVASIPTKRLSEPEEIARYVVFLCSPLATAATGTSITIDGGATRSLA